MWRHRFPRRPSSVQVAMQMWVEVSLVLNWLLLICTLMRLHEGLWGSHDGSIRGSSSSRRLDFLSCWIWKLKVNLISLVKLQGLSGVLLPQRERVFRWMFQINISVFSLRHPGRRKETQAVFSFRGLLISQRPPAVHRQKIGAVMVSEACQQGGCFSSSLSSGGTPEVDFQWPCQRWSLSSVSCPAWIVTLI